MEGGSEPGSMPQLVRWAREFLDRTFLFRNTGKLMRPVALKPWSVVLFDEILPTIFEEVVF